MRVIGAAVGALLLQACSSSAPTAPTPAAELQPEAPPVPVVAPTALDKLKDLARAEDLSPAAMDPGTAPPSGVDAKAVTPLPADQVAPSTKAGRALAATMQEIEATWNPPAPANAEPPRPEDAADALTNFAQARLMILNHDTAKAIPLLQEATRLDPQSSRLWNELGQALLELNRRAAGAAALKQALALGDTSPALCYVLGHEASRSSKTAEALSLLTHAQAALSDGDDPALSYLIMSDLADALRADGRLRAARDATVASINLPDTWGEDTAYRAELAELYRRRFDEWIEVGDLSCRLGDHDLAGEAYDRASSTPALDPGLALPRQVFAVLRAGKPARASLLVLAAIEKADGRFEDRHAELIRYLSSKTALGPDIAAALAEISASLKDRATPSVRSRLARVEAGALPAPAAREALFRAASESPFDLDSVAALVESFPVDEVPQLAAELTRLAQAAPNNVWTAADALLLTGRSVEETLSALAAQPEPPARLVEAAIMARTGRLKQSATRLDSVAGVILIPDLKAAWLAMRVDVAAALADSAMVEQCLTDLAALATPDSSASIRLARAAALRSARQFPESASVAVDACGETPNVYGRLLAADAALRAGDSNSAEKSLLLALNADKYNESNYEALFALYGSSSTPGDSEKLAEAARQLRGAVPSGRLLRILTARDMVAHGLFKDAEPILTELARQSPPDSRAVDLLATLATQAFKTDAAAATRVEVFLRALLASRPDSPTVLAASARATAAIGKGQAAVDMLATRLSYWPMPDLARTRELIIGEALNDPALAGRLARERLEAAPRTFANAAELAELLTREDDLAGAARVLGDALSTGARVSPDQIKAILKLLGQLPAAPTSDEAAKGVLSLFDQLDAQKVSLTSPLVVKRIRYAAQGFASDPAKVFDIASAAARAAPEIGDSAYDIVLKYYADAKQLDRILPFSEQLATRAEPWKSIYTQQWIGAIANWGNADDARRLLKSIESPERRKEFSKLFEGELLPTASRRGDRHDVGAELAYELAGLMLRGQRAPEAIQTYRLALELDPNYHIVENDLGYLLLDRDESPEEAARLLESAFAALPDNSNVVDSIGWLRYKQGRLADRLGETGLVEEEGAITLLERAVRLSENERSSDAVNDHLGDALWRGGKQADAVRAWQSAAKEQSDLLDMFKGGNGEEPPVVQELRDSLAKLRAKIDAAAGGQPKVAPIWPAPGTPKDPGNAEPQPK